MFSHLAEDDVFFDDECYYDFDNGIWGDIDSEFNDNWSDNDPDFLQPGEYVVPNFHYYVADINSIFTQYPYVVDSQNYPVGTFGPYRYPENLEHAEESQASDGFGEVGNIFDEDYRFKLTYGCRNGVSNWEDVNDEAHVKVSPVFDYDLNPFDGGSSSTATAVAFAVIADCDGTIGWGETFYEAYSDALGVSDSEWTSWSSKNSQNGSGDDREPLYDDGSVWTSHGNIPGRVKDIQCRKKNMHSEWISRTAISSPRVHTCSVDTGFSCQASEQIALYSYNYWDDEYWTPESCGNWEIRTLLYDKALVRIRANSFGGDLQDGSLVTLRLSGQESGRIFYQVTSGETLKYRWTARFSEAINEQSRYDVKAGEWQSTGLRVLQSGYRNKVWSYTTNTSASIEVVEPYLIGQISGSHLAAGDVVRLRVQRNHVPFYTFTYTIPSNYYGNKTRWPALLAQVINSQEDSTPVRAGEYSGTTLTYPESSYRNKVWMPDDDPGWSIVIDYNP